jgi:predicted dehydrogenase
MKKKIKVSILGTGFGSLVHIPSFFENKNVEIVSIYGRNKNKLKLLSKKYKIKNTFINFDKLLENTNIDFFCVALPPKEQFFFLKKIIKLKHKVILCEKPFTENYKKAKIIYNLCRKNHCKGFVSYQMRYQPIRKKIKELIKKNFLGKILNVHLSYDYSSRLYPDVDHNWWSKLSDGGGVLNAMGSHQIDLLCWFFGDIKKVFGTQSTYLKYRKLSNGKIKKVTADDISQFILYFKKFKATVSLSSVAVGWKTSVMQIYGTKAALFLNGENKLTLVKKTNSKSQELSKNIDLSIKEPLFKKKWIDNSIWRAAFLRQSIDLVQFAIRKKKYDASDFKNALYIRKVIEKITESAIKEKIISI